VVTPEERSEMNTAEFEPRFRLRTPIRGRTGAEIVGYHWVSHLEEGMFKDRRVSSWEDAQTSVPTGRKIVHLYWVQMPDTGEIILMGVGAAKKALGLTEAKLYSIAKAETAAQRYWKDIWDRQANKPYYGSAIEAKRAWIIANSRSPYFGSDIEKQRSFDEARARAVLMHRDGQWLLTTDQERVYELGLRGWEIVGPTTAPQVESNPPDLDARHAELAAKAVVETITQAELREVQAMVDEAAYSFGYTQKAYHGTHRKFTSFDREYAKKSRIEGSMDLLGSYFTDDPETAVKAYGPIVMSVYLSVRNPKRFQGIGAWMELHDECRSFGGSSEYRKYLQSERFDSVIVEGDYIDHFLQTMTVVLEPSQIKSADPFTFDDDCNLIPLSERFQADSPDIRHNPPYDRERYSEPYSLLEPEHAEQIASELQEEDPDWSYRVQHDPKGTGLSFIEIFDEDGEFVGRWNHA
jgi:hypothetical protein